MRFIYDDVHTSSCLERWAGECSVVKAGSFLWRPGVALMKNKTGLLRVLLYQILQEREDLTTLVVPDDVASILHWTETRLVKALKQVLDVGSLSSFFCIFIDGLDEFDGDQINRVKNH